jgi:hypothetical protein
MNPMSTACSSLLKIIKDYADFFFCLLCEICVIFDQKLIFMLLVLLF